jgi:hypothetical protein
MRPVLVFLLMLAAAGCGSMPFPETVLVPIGPGDPRNLERFQRSMPERFQLLNTVVFEYNWRKFSGIGYVDIDTRNKLFKVVCLNPMGVKLFELSGDQNSTTSHYAIAAFARYGDIAAAVSNDIRRIYFDLAPSPEARIWKRKYRISFFQPCGPGDMEYVFAGAGGDLVEKNYYEDGGIVWQASYYEYREQNGKRFPQGIIFLHYRHGYRLIVKVKEIKA